jgi:hypothetical protein
MQIIGAIVLGVAPYNALTIVMRAGDVSVIAPFRYTRLLFCFSAGNFYIWRIPRFADVTWQPAHCIKWWYTLTQTRKTFAAHIIKNRA